MLLQKTNKMLAIVDKSKNKELEEKQIVIPATVELPADATFGDIPLHIAPETTAEQDRKTEGQRNINFLWENTQKQIALFVVYLACSVSAIVVIVSVITKEISSPLAIAGFTLLSSAMFLITGFYFGRTNHARIGDNDRTIRNSPTLDDRK